VANTFLNHGVNNILLFPLRDELRDFDELWIPTVAFWEEWEGTPTIPQAFLLIFCLLLFGLGVAAAWYRNGWLGLLPLGLNFVYNLWTSLALLSGQRFMLTMDWSIYLYYMIGLFALMSGLLFLLESGRSTIVNWYRSNPFQATQMPLVIKPRYYLMAGLFFFGVGASLPLSETTFKQMYPPASQKEMLATLVLSPAMKGNDVYKACLQRAAAEGQLTIVQGRAIYPRYYSAGMGKGLQMRLVTRFRMKADWCLTWLDRSMAALSFQRSNRRIFFQRL